MSRPTILLIPASFSLPHAYDTLRDGLLAHSQDIVVASLATVISPADHASSSPHPAPTTMYDDASMIVRDIEKLCREQGKDVVVVAHSYSGTPVSQASAVFAEKGLLRGRSKEGKGKGEGGSVVGIAYMTSVVPAVGQSAGDFMASAVQVPDEDRVEMGVTESGWLYQKNPSLTARVCFSDVSPEEGLACVTRDFGLHSPLSFGDKLTGTCWRDAADLNVPISYLLCERDLCITPAAQRAGIASIEEAMAAGGSESGSGNGGVSGKSRKVNVTSIQADHVPNVSKLGEVVDWLLGVTSSAGAVKTD